eukprot:1160281-Pelagomonas_calceolata.AAC.3
MAAAPVPCNPAATVVADPASHWAAIVMANAVYHCAAIVTVTATCQFTPLLSLRIALCATLLLCGG